MDHNSIKNGPIWPAPSILSGLDCLYMACPACPPDPKLNKSIARKSLSLSLDALKRCESCGAASLDHVMQEALDVLIEEGCRTKDDSLRSVGWPMTEIGYPMSYPPRLGKSELIIAGERIGKSAALHLLDIPEIKGVILKKGVPGVVDSRGKPSSWELLAGSDLRADVVQSMFGDLLVHKNQSRIHVEFPRQSSPKVARIEELALAGKARDVVDGLCGPGTLGMICILAGARRVVFNDIWLPAIENLMMNLESNRQALKIDRIDRLTWPKDDVGRMPEFVAKAHGACEIEVYHGDLEKLFSVALPGKLCIIDHFPGSSTVEMQRACKDCGEIVII